MNVFLLLLNFYSRKNQFGNIASVYGLLLPQRDNSPISRVMRIKDVFTTMFIIKINSGYYIFAKIA